jgi:LysR family nod box-dependent transcriptional activator
MRYRKLDLNLLLPLRAVLVEKSVTRAAESLHMSQPAMSGILARLRDFFDDPLVVQVGRRMELTPLGQSMVEPVTELLLRIDATLGTRPAFDPATASQHFSIVASDYVVAVLLADVLQRIHCEAPGVSVELRLPSSTAASELGEGELDLLITPANFSAAAQASRPLFSDGYCLAVDPAYWKGGDQVSLEEYLSLRHAVYESRGKPFFDDWFDHAHGARRHIEVRVHSFQQLPLMVAGTGRVATMHGRLASRVAASAGLQLVHLGFHVPRIEEVLQWHKLRESQPAGQWLRALVLQQAASLPPAAF